MGNLVALELFRGAEADSGSLCSFGNGLVFLPRVRDLGVVACDFLVGISKLQGLYVAKLYLTLCGLADCYQRPLVWSVRIDQSII